MEQNNTDFYMANLPPFVAMGPLTYDLNKIEHRFYMFDRRCVGCVVLIATRPINENFMGTVTLNGERIPGCFVMSAPVAEAGILVGIVIPVRGRVEYGHTYMLRIEGFKTADNEEIEVMELPLSTSSQPKKDPKYAKHDLVALNTAREGIVLMKNKDNVLPLAPDSTLNLFGEGVTNFRTGATGAGRINPRCTFNLREAATELSSYKLNEELDRIYALPVNLTPDKDTLERAKQQNDTAIIIITRGTGENIDNNPLPGEYYLSNDEESMIGAVCEVFDKTVVILNTGYPIDMRWTEKYEIKAIIYAGLAGQCAAEALCEILDGRVNPSGKLSDTWSWDYYDIPSSKNFLTVKAGEKPIMADDDVWVDTCYEEGIYVGYRYFETFAKEVAFPFGHGLSYTEFDVKAEKPEWYSDCNSNINAKITVTVKNIGIKAGKEVIMLYAKLPATVQEQPLRQLVAFGKTTMLNTGESESITLEINSKYLSTYSVSEQAWVLEQGDTEFYIGGSVREAVPCGTLWKESKETLTKTKYSLPSPVPFEEMSQNGKPFPTGGLTKIREGAHGLSDKLERAPIVPKSIEVIKSDRIITYPELKSNPVLLDKFVVQMDISELCRFNMMYGHGWSMDAKGEAGRIAPSEKYQLPDYVCADGNSGVNVNKPNIGMPTSVIVCSTFNASLAQQVGRIIGEEAVENDIHMILATAMNIHRNPLCGRHPEYFSEDPYLAGIMAAAQVQGLHDAGVSDSVKHTICNNCETARKRNHSIVGERAMREIYLRAFEILIDNVKPDTIMTSYSALNGEMCGSDVTLIDGIFREELGFDGFAMADWNSYDTVDMVEAVNAGISWLTPGENDGSRVAVLEKAASEGKITRARLEENVKRVFAIMLRRNIV